MEFRHPSPFVRRSNQSDNRPNILWLCTDQQRFDTIASLGNEHIRTPHIDRLAATGVTCTHAFCQSPICTPSRSSFLTGMYASTVHGCGNGNDKWAEAAPLVTKLLKDGGYCCGLSGKLHLAGCHGRVEPRAEDDGYEVFHWSHSHRDMWPEGHAYADWVAEQGGHLGKMYRKDGYMRPELHQTKFCADKAIAFMELNWDQPWLMSVNFFDPHHPFDAPPEYADRYKAEDMPDPIYRESDLAAQAKLKGVEYYSAAKTPEEHGVKEKMANYYAMIEQVDDHVGRLLDTLEETGQLENTLVIFMSDHGESMGDHGLMLKGCRFYEGSVRVPLIFSWPGTLPAGRKTDALVELLDIAPTLLDYAGLEAPKEMAGRSLRGLLEGKTETHRESVRCEYYRALSLLTPGREDWGKGSFGTMVRDARYKFIVYHGHAFGELFDLERDPEEFENLWEDPAYAEVRFKLMLKAFDQTVDTIDLGTEVTRYF